MCPNGFEGDGRTCTRVATGSACSLPGVCHPLARCIEQNYLPSCICPPGYVGTGFGSLGCLPGSTDLCRPNPCAV